MSRLSDEARRKIHQAFGKTGSIRAAARQARVSRNAVRRELKQLVTPRAPKSIPRKSKLDPYKAKIGYLVREKRLSADWSPQRHPPPHGFLCGHRHQQV